MRMAIHSVIFAGATLAFGCGPAHSPEPEPLSVSQVTIPEDQGRVPDAPRPGFDCKLDRPAPNTRISFELVQLAPDGGNLGETRAVYQIDPEFAGGPKIAKARVVLLSFATTNNDRTASAWSIALDADWIRMREPFEIERTGTTWCFAEGCEDAQRREVATAIGETADLLVLPELARELGQPTGQSSIEVPQQLLRRVGLGQREQSQLASSARRRGTGFPARYVLDGQNSAETTDGSPLTAELEVTQSCRLASLRILLAGTRAEYENDARVRYRFTWRFDPVRPLE